MLPGVLRAPPPQYRQLQEQQFFKGQARTSLTGFLHVAGEMAGKNSLGPAGVPPPCEHLRGQGVAQVHRKRRRLVQQGTDGAHAQVRGARVHGHQPQDVPAFVGISQYLVALDHEDGGSALAQQHPLQEHLGPLPEGRLQIRLVVPQGHHAAAVVAHEGFEHLHPAARSLPRGARQHAPPQRDFGAEAQRRHAHQPGGRLVPERQVKQQFADGGDTKPPQPAFGGLAHAAQS